MKADVEEMILNTGSQLEFEKLYLAVRSLEKRIYSDEEVRQLPAVPREHQYRKEWVMRQYSAGRLVDYLKRKRTPLRILEVGSGNGWLSALMATVPGSRVTGMDVNCVELEQASRVFASTENLDFVYGAIDSKECQKEYYDVIVFAASLQYFPSVKNVIRRAMTLLNRNGEIHILDTPFYEAGAIAQAKQRSSQYFEQLGFPGMKRYYMHHSLGELNDFDYSVCYDPGTLVNKWRGRNPFHWLRINKK